MNWRSKRRVLLLVGLVCGALFVAGMAAAWVNRNQTICKSGREPVQTTAGVIGQVVYTCDDGRIVTMNN